MTPESRREIRRHSVRIAREAWTYPTLHDGITSLQFQSCASHQGWTGWMSYKRAIELVRRWVRRHDATVEMVAWVCPRCHDIELPRTASGVLSERVDRTIEELCDRCESALNDDDSERARYAEESWA